MEPQTNKSGDPERWPWSIGAWALATVPPPLAIRVEGVTTPRGTANRISDKRRIRELYAALDPPSDLQNRACIQTQAQV